LLADEPVLLGAMEVPDFALKGAGNLVRTGGRRRRSESCRPNRAARRRCAGDRRGAGSVQVATLCVAYAGQLREELADWDGRALTRFDSWS
jgi:hypothetical protein